EVEKELETQQVLLQQIQSHRALWEHRQGKGQAKDSQRLIGGGLSDPRKAGTRAPGASVAPTAPDSDTVIPVVVIACDRVTVRRCLDKLLQYRPSAALHPIIVSQDCGHEDTARAIAAYGERVTHLRQPELGDMPVRPEHRKFQGYYKIARHYRWALGQVFNTLGYSAAVIVEDDLEVAPDFFEYFRALLPLLRQDPSLWCVSAWNDNGREGVVDAGAPELLYRTDFFPGLGWMLLRELWAELEPKWPAAFWDDWMRQPEQRRGRACLRPEVSRTLTFGRKGVSLGQFFDQYLRYIKLNSQFVPFTRLDLSYLEKAAYDRTFEEKVYSAPLVRPEELTQGGGQLRGTGPYRVQYSSRDSFKVFAKALGVMDDLKSGVPRAGYRGVVSFLHKGRRVYLAPPPGWKGYDTTWS
ncbi:MGAT1 acetylglucosaminyltransferase, partial [Amia calva]|nr:MGAT1 acetylglucosaminyltransferase [Amia calva]